MKILEHAQNLSQVLSDQTLTDKEFQKKNLPKEELNFWADVREDSFVHNLPEAVKNRVMEIPNYLLLMSEDELERRLEPDELTSQMRVSFWEQYEVMLHTKKNFISIAQVHANICSREYFYRVFLRDDKKMAWMLKPTHNYEIRAKSLLDLGYRQMARILRMPLLDPKTGKPDHIIIEKMLKITMMLDQRVKGAVIQKLQVHQKTESINHNYTRDASAGLPAQSELESIEKELLELRGPSAKLISVADSNE